MQRDNSGPPNGRGFLDGFFDDPFSGDLFSRDPFFHRHSAFFSSPFVSASRPFGSPFEDMFHTGRQRMRSMQGLFAPPQSSGTPSQSLPAPHIVEMDAGEAPLSSSLCWEQPRVEHPDSDSDSDDPAEDGASEEAEEETEEDEEASLAHASVRDIPIQWDDAPAPVPPRVSEVDPEVDMDWQPDASPASAPPGVTPPQPPERERERSSYGRQGDSSQAPPQHSDIGWRSRERSFPRSWVSHPERKGAQR